jgi:hypothetical protein
LIRCPYLIALPVSRFVAPYTGVLAVESNAGDPHGCGEVEQRMEQLPGAVAEALTE